MHSFAHIKWLANALLVRVEVVVVCFAFCEKGMIKCNKSCRIGYEMESSTNSPCMEYCSYCIEA